MSVEESGGQDTRIFCVFFYVCEGLADASATDRSPSMFWEIFNIFKDGYDE